MSNFTKSNDSFRPRPETGRMHRVTVDVWLPGNPGEIYILAAAARAVSTLAARGMMPTNTHMITREILDTTLEELIRE